jgi:hypothetical protein
MFQYHSVQTHIDLQNGKRRNKTQRVSIKGSKGFKQVTILSPTGKRRTSKKPLSKKEIACIRKCQFIPGLFRDCEECLV